MRLLLHDLGDVLVISRFCANELIAVTLILRIVILRSIGALFFTAVVVPSLIASIKSLHITMA
jgi:hypothetical protein